MNRLVGVCSVAVPLFVLLVVLVVGTTHAQQSAPPLALQWGTYLGGSGIDKAFHLALGPDGTVYLTGWTTSTDFPTANAYQSRYGGDWDAFVTRLDCAGSRVLFSTYFGGAGEDNRFANGISVAAGGGIAVDVLGNAYITGRTTSDDFPVRAPMQRRRAGGVDAFVAKFNPQGLLVYSTYFGGTAEDEGWGIAVDHRGHVFLIGKTFSNDLPVTKPVFFPVRRGGSDAFFAELDETGQLVSASYLGGSGDEFPSTLSGGGVVVDTAGDVYVVGDTDSVDFPVTAGVYQRQYRAAWDAFVVKFNPVQRRVVYSTFIGGLGADNARGAAVDRLGNLYITGHTSGQFPVTGGTYQERHRGLNDAFLAKLNADGTRLVFATYLGGSQADIGMDVSVDANGVATVVGFTDSTDFPLASPLSMPFAGPRMGFITQFSPDASQVTQSTYFGGNDNDVGYAVASAASGALHVAARTSSTDWPVPGAFQPSPGGGQDAYVARLASPAAVNACQATLPGERRAAAVAVKCKPLGSAHQCTATATFSDGSNQNVTRQARWSTSNPNVAQIDSAGTVAKVTDGVVVVRAVYDDLYGTTTLDLRDISISFDDQVSPFEREVVQAAVNTAQTYFQERLGRRVTPPARVSVRYEEGNVPAFAGNGVVTINVLNSGWTSTTINLQRKIVVHEVFHLLQSQAGWGTVPNWLLEGAAEVIGFRAVVEAGYLRGSDVRDCHTWNLTTQSLPPLSTFETTILSSVPGSTYSLAWYGVEYAITGSEIGLNSLPQYWSSNPTSDWRAAFERAFRIGVGDFYTRFEQLRQTLRPPSSGGASCTR